MLKIILTVGAPASGKSFWSKQEIAKDPNNWLRINNDLIREMFNGSVFSPEYEKFVSETRTFLIKEGLRRNKNIIVDNVNADSRHFKQTCELAKASGKDVNVFEKSFYEELSVLIERDSKREGNARVGEEVIQRFWKKLGGKQHKHYKPKSEMFFKQKDLPALIKQKENARKALMVDLDGTASLFNKINDDGTIDVMYPEAHARNPYDASTAHLDMLNQAVATVINRFAKDVEIIFCSGRKKEFEPQTRQFLDKHFPTMPYLLFMRENGDSRKDSIVKEEIYRNNIENDYNVLFVMDDRTSVVNQWRSMGLTCFQVAAGDF